MGAITIVRRCLFISLGEMTTQGRVFLISLPMVGSRFSRLVGDRPDRNNHGYENEGDQ